MDTIHPPASDAHLAIHAISHLDDAADSLRKAANALLAHSPDARHAIALRGINRLLKSLRPIRKAAIRSLRK